MQSPGNEVLEASEALQQFRQELAAVKRPLGAPAVWRRHRAKLPEGERALAWAELALHLERAFHLRNVTTWLRRMLDRAEAETEASSSAGYVKARARAFAGPDDEPQWARHLLLCLSEEHVLEAFLSRLASFSAHGCVEERCDLTVAEYVRRAGCSFGTARAVLFARASCSGAA